MELTIRREWLEPDYIPATLAEGAFLEMDAEPLFGAVYAAAKGVPKFNHSLGEFAHELLVSVYELIENTTGPIHVLLSGGYDSRMIAHLCEELGKEPLYIGDGAEEPTWSKVLDHLNIPAERRYTHDMSGDDPYGLTHALVAGFAPLYTQLRFMPIPTEPTTLITGLGGGEWFSYPASGWHKGKQHRIPHTGVLEMWMDCWPQYTMIPEAWGRNYDAMLNPYCTPAYGKVAARCKQEWLYEVDQERYPELDAVRAEMLAELDPALAALGYQYHYYDWKLSDANKAWIDGRYLNSPYGSTFHRTEFGLPSAMELNKHSCTLAGFSTWCDVLATSGFEIR